MNKEYSSAIYQIISTGHWLTDQVSTELKDFGITEPQFNVLRILRGAKGKPITVHEILEHMIQRSSNITRIIDKLLVNEYVMRKECTSNRRRMDITISKEGLQMLKKLDNKVEAFHHPFENKLNIKELKTLKNLILKLKS